MITWRHFISTILAVVTTAFSGSAPAGYLVEDLGLLPGFTDGVAYSISNSGQVVGTSTKLDPSICPQCGIEHGFLYSKGTLTDLSTLGGSSSHPTGINTSGQIVGYSNTASSQHAFLYIGGTITDLGTLGGDFSQAFAINASGQVVGASQVLGQGPYHAFLYDGGTMIDIGTLGGPDATAHAISANGKVVGWSTTTRGSVVHAFLYDGQTMVDLGTLPGENDSRAFGINARGDIVGTSGLHSFLIEGGEMRDIGGLGTILTMAHGINNRGEIVGESLVAGNPANVDHAFLYNDGQMADLNDLVNLNHTGLQYLGAANAINDRGEIGGWALGNDSRFHAFLLTRVPEPTTIMLLGLALSGIGLARRRRPNG